MPSLYVICVRSQKVITKLIRQQQNIMDPALDKNGNWVQRRKMYEYQFPLHNLKSQFQFNWEGDEQSFQDMHGLKYRRKRQNEQIKKKYTQSLDKKFRLKYVQCIDDNQLIRQNISKKLNEETLSKQLQQFNNSKLIASKTIQVRPEMVRSNEEIKMKYKTDFQDQAHKYEERKHYEPRTMQYNYLRKNQYEEMVQKAAKYQSNTGSPKIQYVPKYVPSYPNYLNYNTIMPNNMSYSLQPRRLSQSYNKNAYNLQKAYKNGANPQRNAINRNTNNYEAKPTKLNLNFSDFHDRS